MTLQEIAIFKHFIAEKDLRKPFIKCYRQSHEFAKLPVNIEDFFSNVQPLAVILSSMKVFSTNATFGFDFWQSLHQDWKIYYEKHKDMGTSTLPMLAGYYSILRENWNDKDKPWRFESLEDACKRLGLEPPAPKEEKEPEKKPEPEDIKEEENEEEELDFVFVDVDKTEVRKRLVKGTCSINTRNKAYRLTLNTDDSRALYSLGFDSMRIAEGKDGKSVYIVFGKVGRKCCHSHDKQLTISSKAEICKLKSMLDIKDDYCILPIKEASSTANYIAYTIKKA